MIRKLFYKLFVGGEWAVALRKRGETEPFAIVEAPENHWIADPFLFERQGEHWLFVELCHRKENRGKIALYRMENGKTIFQKTILDQDCHLSYPCVFSWEGQAYLIPESAGRERVELYRATDFPERWELDAVLLSGARYVDSTVWMRGGEPELFTYIKGKKGYDLTRYSLDLNQKRIAKIGTKHYEKNVARPAGSPWDDIRPAQNCARKYGENLIFYRVEEGAGLDEKKIGECFARQIPAEGKFHRIHTYSRDSVYEAVDLYRERIDFLKILKIAKRKLFRGK